VVHRIFTKFLYLTKISESNQEISKTDTRHRQSVYTTIQLSTFSSTEDLVQDQYHHRPKRR